MRGFGELVILFFSEKKCKKIIKTSHRIFIPMNYHSCIINFFFKFIESLYSQHTRNSDMIHLQVLTSQDINFKEKRFLIL